MQQVTDMLTLLVLLEQDLTQYVWIKGSGIRYCSRCMLNQNAEYSTRYVVAKTLSELSGSCSHSGPVLVVHADPFPLHFCSWCATTLENTPCDT